MQKFKSLALLKVRIEPFEVPYSPILSSLISLWFQMKWTNTKQEGLAWSNLNFKSLQLFGAVKSDFSFLLSNLGRSEQLNKTYFFIKQDWHYASILGLSMCTGVKIIAQPKLHQKNSPWSPASGVDVLMRYERFKVTITTPLRQWKHTRKHSAFFGDDTGQYLV